MRFPNDDEAVEFAERHAGEGKVQVWLGGMLIKLVDEKKAERPRAKAA